ncbi:MAG: 16S rRNA (adenine(1518)-N(6)/adenine(1519)-N(6))-dimethyltransferase RsmA [Deltaproteobacteria bacterium]|nr:16S rRNA (adenine(1518)-N(6)/adenine(1519)-N(6))-dimethyltransferase RsmA [Deltaproteobacteria bacterium]
MTTIRKILRDHGIRPLKRLGQSFLEDINVINKIISISNIQEDDTVVEIGAGVGIMTELIAEKVRKVIALEIDPRMVGILRERLAGYHQVDVIKGDVLKYDFSSVGHELLSRKIKVVGNIPYNISSQILFHLLAYRQHISSMILMFQKELADRLIASPGTKEYGIPTVLVSMYTECFREMVIPRSCFYPEPKVTSSVMKIIIREKPLMDLNDHDFFVKIVKIAFSKRRKTLLNNLRSSPLLGYTEREVVTALKKSDIDGVRRGETLTAEELGKLSNALYSREIP